MSDFDKCMLELEKNVKNCEAVNWIIESVWERIKTG